MISIFGCALPGAQCDSVLIARFKDEGKALAFLKKQKANSMFKYYLMK